MRPSRWLLCEQAEREADVPTSAPHAQLGTSQLKDMVKISMDIFVKKFQPDRYHLWKQGKDIYTIDHTQPTPESTPEVKMWMQRKKIRKPSRSLQHTRSRSKKLKTPEDEKISAMVIGAEVVVTETTTDGFKVTEKPVEKKGLVNAGIPSGEENTIKGMQVDQRLSDNVKVSGSSVTSSSKLRANKYFIR
ncbi:lysine-specific demethylase 4C-like [Gracilinanus agilis]|uniref:lysine-specific demethylase 4C-like n=1 Tax=Gracilinanus agilis TaxID=191870 RepID=UPI001CFE7EE3|nr:lysine-specific demethylase 4C-like [Gracilinanus agilis]